VLDLVPEFAIGILFENSRMDFDVFEDRSKKLAKEGSKPKFAYVLPTFRGPAGVIMQADKRKRMTEILKGYDTLALERDSHDVGLKCNECVFPSKMGRQVFFGRWKSAGMNTTSSRLPP